MGFYQENTTQCQQCCVGSWFLTWANSLQSLICVLRGTSSYLDDQHLHDQIEAAVDEELCISACDANAQDSVLMHDFLNIYKVCDAKRKAAQKQFFSIADKALHTNKCSYSVNKENTSSFHPYNNQGSGSRMLSSSTAKCNFPPKSLVLKGRQ